MQKNINVLWISRRVHLWANIREKYLWTSSKVTIVGNWLTDFWMYGGNIVDNDGWWWWLELDEIMMHLVQHVVVAVVGIKAFLEDVRLVWWIVKRAAWYKHSKSGAGGAPGIDGRTGARSQDILLSMSLQVLLDVPTNEVNDGQR